jgi:hypothetical protein
MRLLVERGPRGWTHWSRSSPNASRRDRDRLPRTDRAERLGDLPEPIRSAGSLRRCYPLRPWVPPPRNGRCRLAHLSTSTRCHTGPAASLARGSGKSGRLTYLAAVRSGTFKNLTISAKPSRSPGRTGDEPRTSQDTWRHCCHEVRSRGTLPLTSTLPHDINVATSTSVAVCRRLLN